MVQTTPWWETIRLRDEIVSASGVIADVQMSLFSAVHGVAGGGKVPYSDPRYYGEITFPSASLVGLMAQIAVRLGATGGDGARALWRLDQGMGGGKSHGLIGLWHLVTNPTVLAETDLGKLVFAEAGRIAGKGNLATDLGRPACVVLSCDNMTPGKGDKTLDGPAETLGERFLWRLFDGASKTWNEFREHTSNKDRLAEALNRVGRPVLILVDEVMDYIRAASALGDDKLVVQDMAFLRALLDTVNDVPNCAMVFVLISSERDSMVLTDLGSRCRDELHDLLVRNGETESVTSANDFADIIRRRLFDGSPPKEVVGKTGESFRTAMGGKWGKEVFDRLSWANVSEWNERVMRSYPFHPSLIDLAEQEWSLHTGFQRVRSTIQIFAATVWEQQQRAKSSEWVPGLVGLGDLPLSARDVREALLNSGLIEDQRTVSSYREIAGTEVVADDDERGTARQLDLKGEPAPIYAEVNPRAVERTATALFLYSISPRPQGRRGATEYELKAASFVPDATYGVGDAEVVMANLRSPETGLAALEEIPGKGGQPARLLLSTRQTLNMFIRAQRNAVSDPDRDSHLAELAWDLANTGPFQTKVRVEAGNEESDNRSLIQVIEAAGIDDARTNRLVVLDPRRFSLLNGIDEDTRQAVRSAMGIGPTKLAVGWASSAVFAVVNTQRRAHARKLAVEYLARKRVADIEAVRADEDLFDKAKAEVKEAESRLRKAIRDAYQHVIYLGEDAEGNRADRTLRFDKEGQSSLDGSIVWAALADADKAFGKGEFDAQALLHNLRPTDWGRPLSEIRDGFWNTPRLALLPDGDEDLRRAVFKAISEGKVRLVDKDGIERKATSPSEINLGSSGLRIAKAGETLGSQSVVVPNVVGLSGPVARVQLEAVGLWLSGYGDGAIATQVPEAGATVEPNTPVAVLFGGLDGGETIVEHQVSITVTTSLADDSKRNPLRLLLNSLANAVDESASHVQMTLKITLPTDAKDEVVTKANAVTPHVSTTDL